MNDQRKVIYEQRIELMRAQDVQGMVADMRHEVIENMVTRFVPEKSYAEKWETHALHEECLRVLGLDLPVDEWAKEDGIAEQEILDRIKDASDKKMAEKASRYTPEVMRMAEKSLLLQILDQQWKDHLLSLDHLRQGIGLRAYAQRDPLNEYKSEAFNLFNDLLIRLRETVTSVLSHMELRVTLPGDDRQPAQAAVAGGGFGGPMTSDDAYAESEDGDGMGQTVAQGNGRQLRASDPSASRRRQSRIGVTNGCCAADRLVTEPRLSDVTYGA